MPGYPGGSRSKVLERDGEQVSVGREKAAKRYTRSCLPCSGVGCRYTVLSQFVGFFRVLRGARLLVAGREVLCSRDRESGKDPKQSSAQ